MIIVQYTVEYNNSLPALVKESSCNYPAATRLDTPNKIVTMLNDVFHLNRKTEEYLYLIGFNARAVPVGVFEVSHGVINASFSSSREIFQRLLLCNAASFVLAHNHPSGCAEPSAEDVKIFHTIKDVAKLMRIDFSDNLILGDGNSYYSFLEQRHFNY